MWAIEGTGSYGAGLAVFLDQHGERVVEIGRRVRRSGPSRAKSDPLDAIEAAREALGQPRHAAPRAAGEREALRVLVNTREGAVLARTAAINQLRALIVAAPEPLRANLRGLSFAELLTRCAQLRPGARDASTRATSCNQDRVHPASVLLAADRPDALRRVLANGGIEMALFGKLVTFARSPQGRRLLVQAQKAARDPQNRERLEKARSRIQKRGDTPGQNSRRSDES